MNEVTRVKIDFKDLPLERKKNLYTYVNTVDWVVYSTEELPPFITKEAEESLVKHKTISTVFGYGSKEKESNAFASYYGAACFYAIIAGIYKCKANRIAFYPRFQEANKDWANRFLNLCKIYKFLPEYTEDNLLDKSKRVVLDLKDLSVSQTYLYLCLARYPQEYPCVSNCTVELVDKYGMNFLLALSAAHYLFCSGNGHTLQEGYPTSSYNSIRTVEALRKMEVDILHAASWKKYLDDPLEYDSRKIVGPSYAGFKLQDTMRKVAAEIIGNGAIPELYNYSSTNKGHLYLARSSNTKPLIDSTVVTFEDLFDEDIIMAVMADSIEETRDKMKAFRDKKIIYIDESLKVEKVGAEKIKKPRKRMRKAAI